MSFRSFLKMWVLEPCTRCASVLMRGWTICLLSMAIGGCCSSKAPSAGSARPFVFEKDSMAFQNELVREYFYDEQGEWKSRKRRPRQDYTHHCFVVARTAKQFFDHARFAPEAGLTNRAEYRRLIRRVASRNLRRTASEEERVVIPGYADLRTFSAAHGALLKSASGGAWRSYVQRGHWRIMSGFSERHQERAATQFVESLSWNRPVIAHLVRFPALTINHAVVLFAAVEEDDGLIRFSAYDPNNSFAPVVLTYDRQQRAFTFTSNDYFPGGKVDVYEIYHSCMY